MKKGNVQTAKWWLALKCRNEFGDQMELPFDEVQDNELRIVIVDDDKNE